METNKTCMHFICTLCVYLSTHTVFISFILFCSVRFGLDWFGSVPFGFSEEELHIDVRLYAQQRSHQLAKAMRALTRDPISKQNRDVVENRLNEEQPNAKKNCPCSILTSSHIGSAIKQQKKNFFRLIRLFIRRMG